MIGPEMVHLMELPNPDPMEGRPEVRIPVISVWSDFNLRRAYIHVYNNRLISSFSMEGGTDTCARV